jgi:D-ribose pyranase
VVDLAFRFGVPPFETVLSGLLDELVIEGATAAGEVRERNPRTYRLLAAYFPDLDLVPHEELKREVAAARLVVRTGEAAPFANVMLRCGVPF